MKTTQLIVLGLVIGIGIGAGYFFFANFKGTEAPHENVLMATTNAPSGGSATSSVAAVASAPLSFTWEFKDVTKASDTNSSTQVSLVAGGKSHVLGTYQGSCKTVAANETGVLGEKADADELSPRVQCWFAGGGDEIGLFKDGAGYSVKVGQLEEGIEGGAAFRGNFKTTIPL